MLTSDDIQMLDERDSRTFNGALGVVFTEQSQDFVQGYIDLHEGLHQPFGFLHGGVTLALLEAVASRAVDLKCDFEVARPFGIEINAQHKRPAKYGKLYATAALNHEERNKQFWDVRAYDDQGLTVSEGIFVTKIVSLERLREKGDVWAS